MASSTRIIPVISTQFMKRWKKITLRIDVTIGCKASMMLTTSEGAKFDACSSKPNGKIVPKRMTVPTDSTSVVEICGGLTHMGR